MTFINGIEFWQDFSSPSQGERWCCCICGCVTLMLHACGRLHRWNSRFRTSDAVCYIAADAAAAAAADHVVTDVAAACDGK